jgi:HNH endonuclease
MATLSDRFWAKVDRRSPADCWEWQAARNRDGYGVFLLHRQCNRAHRVAYLLERGLIPTGLVVRHRCDTPACCNPDHLELGTQAQNVQDMVERGRQKGPSSARSRSTKLTCAQVEEIRRATGTIKQLGAQYGVHFSTIARIRRGDTWRAS